MIRYYTNRELSGLFNINLAKWKRWSRAFLPPDPLGGLQSGYARQYTQDDAFTVFLGGHLVGDMRFTIPVSKQILADLSTWLGAAGFYENQGADPDKPPGLTALISSYRIYVQSGSDFSGNPQGVTYAIRGIVSRETVTVNGYPVVQEQYHEQVLGCRDKPDGRTGDDVTKILDISVLFRRFCKLLGKL